MNKPLLTVLLASLFTFPVTAQAKSPNDCAMAKYMAGHALTVIKGGATLDQTLGMFENNVSNQMIIKEIYSRKDSLAQKKEAETIGAKMCMQASNKV